MRTIEVRLPDPTSSREAHSGGPDDASLTTPEAVNLLLVEDNPGDARLVAEALKDVGFPVVLEQAGALRDAVERLDKNGIDLVLLDLGLPDSVGIDTFRTIRRNAPTVPVLVLTGLRDDDAAATAVREGAQDYLLKEHVRADVLKRVLTYSLERSRLTTELALHAREQSAVAEVSRLALEGIDPDDLLEQASSIIADGLGVPLVEILELEADGRGRYRAGNGWSSDLRGRPLPGPEIAYAAVVIGHDGSLRMDDSATEGRFQVPQRHIDHGVASGLAVGVPVGEEAVLVLGAYAIGRRRFVDRDEHFISAVANVLAQAQEQSTTEIQNTRLRRLYTVLADANREMVRAKDRDQLFAEVCRVVVESGGFRMAWIGVVDQPSGRVDPVVSAGHDDGYTAGLRILLDAPDRGRGPVGTAVRDGRHSVVNILARDARMLPWRHEALSRGYLSVAAFPLKVVGIVVASLAVYAAEPGFFDDAELELFDDLVADVSFVLEALVRDERRRVAERAVLDAEARYVGLFENVLEGVFQASPDGVILAANPALAHMLGHASPADLVDAAPRLIMLAPNRGGLEELFKRIGEEGVVAGLETELHREDGSAVWVSFNVRGIKDDDGTLTRIDGTVVDITARKRAEETLMRRDAMLEAVAFAAASFLRSPMWQGGIDEVLEQLGTAADVSRAYVFENVGSGPEMRAVFRREWRTDGTPALIDDPYLSELPYSEASLARFRTCLESGRAFVASEDRTSEEHDLMEAYGVVAALAVPVFVGSTWWGFLGLGQTQRPRRWSQAEIDALRTAADALGNAIARQAAEQSLREQRERLNALMQTAPIGIVLVDEDGTITYANPGAERILGLERSEIATRSYDDPAWEITDAEGGPFPSEDLPFTRVMTTGEPVYGVKHAITYPDGRRVVLSINGAPLTAADGSISGMVASLLDITEEKLASDRLTSSYELLQKADNERRRLLARLVDATEQERRRLASEIHDDPVQKLTAAAMRLELVAGKLGPDELGDAVGKAKQVVDEAVGGLRKLMFDLQPPVLEREGLGVALRTYLDQLQREEELTCRLSGQLAIEPDLTTRSVAYRIAQEALMNVRKHSRATNVHLALTTEQDGIRVKITDDGVGFDAAVLDEIRPGHLGLTDVRERAEMTGGWLRIDTSPGRGTTVEYWLPLHPPGGRDQSIDAA